MAFYFTGEEHFDRHLSYGLFDVVVIASSLREARSLLPLRFKNGYYKYKFVRIVPDDYKGFSCTKYYSADYVQLQLF